jgi:hypothetical protein
MIHEFLVHYGTTLAPKMDINANSFFTQLFLFCLHTAASEELADTGLITLEPIIGSVIVQIPWQTFFSEAQDWFSKKKSVNSTPRRWLRACDDLFWYLWNNPDIEGLNDVKSHGTALSQKFRDSDGRPIKAYVAVPYMFTEHLTPDELLVRKTVEDYVTKRISNQGPSHLGLNDNSEGSDDLLYASSRTRILRENATIKTPHSAGVAGQGPADLPHLYSKFGIHT